MFLKRKITDDGCWIWTGLLDKDGYGILSTSYFKMSVHRIAAFIWLKDFTEDQQALHKITCPRKNCFNPDHLYSGTHQDNMNDIKTLKSHHNTKKTQCPKGHEYTEENTYLDSRKRKCKKCRILRNMIRIR